MLPVQGEPGLNRYYLYEIFALILRDLPVARRLRRQWEKDKQKQDARPYEFPGLDRLGGDCDVSE